MKYRSDFITNSSSSNFVVAFPRRPNDEHDLHDMLFGHDDETKTVSLYDQSFTSGHVALTIWHEVMDKKAAGINDIYNELSCSWDFYDSRNDYQGEDDNINNNQAYVASANFFNKNQGKFVCILSFGDETSLGALIEHSEDIWKKVAHKRISHH